MSELDSISGAPKIAFDKDVTTFQLNSQLFASSKGFRIFYPKSHISPLGTVHYLSEKLFFI